ncbi:MAG: hypothetical protein PUH14_01945, partial [Collinsella sp.]|nr:hypothetical protein [Collinsella sp.]MDY5550955.1 hypothetical protein [Collinsella sp.]
SGALNRTCKHICIKKGPEGFAFRALFKTYFICRFIDLCSVANLSDAERTTKDALRRELLVNWDELFTVTSAG